MWSDNIAQAQTPVCGPLNAPAGLAGAALSRNTAEVNWVNTNEDEPTLFYLERSLNGASSWSQIVQLPDNITRYVDSDLQCGQAYDYRLRVFRPEDNSMSTYSNGLTLTTQACPAPSTAAIGLYKEGIWQFWNTHETSAPQLVFNFGPREAGWIPVTGDWNGDGIDGIALYKNGTWIVRDVSANGPVERVVTFGLNEAGW